MKTKPIKTGSVVIVRYYDWSTWRSYPCRHSSDDPEVIAEVLGHMPPQHLPDFKPHERMYRVKLLEKKYKGRKMHYSESDMQVIPNNILPLFKAKYGIY